MNKPLTKEERESICSMMTLVGENGAGPAMLLVGAIKESMSAESHWREAVKRIAICYNGDRDYWECHACEAYGKNGRDKLPHKPDCPWLLAQE